MQGGDAAEGSAAASASANSKKKGKKTAGPPEVKVIIAKIQRQKRKYVTAVAGLETVPGTISRSLMCLNSYSIGMT